MAGREAAGDDAEALRAELDRLPEDLRAPLELRYLAGLTNAEVAATLGLPQRTLEERLHDGRERLRRRLAPLLLGPPLAAGPAAEAAPPGLLPGLLSMVRGGAALRPPAAAGLALVTEGVVMAKKTVIVSGALAILLFASLAASIAVLRRSPGTPPEEPLAAVSAPAAEPGGSAAAVTGRTAHGEDTKPAPPAEPPRASLHGVVKDEEGAVLPGGMVVFGDNVPPDHAARLKALGYRDVPDGEWGLTTTTDASGEFHFDGLLPGVADARAKGPGLWGGGSDVELEAGKTTWQLMVSNYLRRLHGRVATSDGAPLRGAAVLVRSQSVAGAEHLPRVGGENHDYVVFSVDERGQFDTGHCLGSFPAGGTTLVAWADGRAMNLQGKPRFSEEPYVASVDFVLEPEMPLELTVRDPARSPVEGAEISLVGERGDIYGWVPYPLCSTDAAGRARVEHLERKSQTLRVAKAGFHPATLALKGDGPREATVELQPEPAGAELTVRLVYQEPFPALVQSWGELRLERLAPGGTFQPDSEGGTSLDHKVPQVVFRPAQGGRFRCRLVYRDGGEGIGEPFDYAVREPATVDLHVALPGPYVAGILVDAATGSPLAGRPVTAHYHRKGRPPQARNGGTGYGNVLFPWPAGLRRACETDASGGFLMLLPRDECPLEVSVGVDEVRVGWARAEALGIGADDRVSDVRLELHPGGAIEGRVVGASGAPVPGETITAYDGGANLDRKTSDGEGKFRFSGLPPGAYAIEAIGVITSEVAHGAAEQVFAAGVLDPAEVFERRVIVREGETTPWTIVLERDRLGAIEGSLGDGLPPTGTVEHRMLIDGQPWEGWHDRMEVREGAFRFPNRHAGLYRVTFRAPGVAAEATAEVRRGRVTRVLLRPASGTLTIPLPALAPRELEGLDVALVQRRGHAAPGAEDSREPWAWEAWSERRAEIRDGAIVIAGLPGGTWRARIVSPHLPDAWTEPAHVEDGLSAEAPVLEFPRPCEARIRLELEDGSPLPADARIEVFGLRGAVSFGIEPSPDDSAVRRLSKLPPGDLIVSATWEDRWARVPLFARVDEVAEARLVLQKR
jgi:protocatechuate 3,4-dioxygenase beta subunit